MLTLPGWMEDRRAPSRAVHFLNPREIAKFVDTDHTLLDGNFIKRICYQLEQKSKVQVN